MTFDDLMSEIEVVLTKYTHDWSYAFNIEDSYVSLRVTFPHIKSEESEYEQ